MYDIELTIQINQYKHRELMELAEKERLIKFIRLNRPSNQSHGAKIAAWLKQYPRSGGNSGNNANERSIKDPCLLSPDSNR